MKTCLKRGHTLITQFTWKKDYCYCPCLLLMAAIFSGSTYLILSKGAPVSLVVRPLMEMQGGSVVPKGSRVLASRLSTHVHTGENQRTGLLEGGHKLALCLTLR